MAEQKYKFQLTCKSKIFGIKTCEMRLETGECLPICLSRTALDFVLARLNDSMKAKRDRRLSRKGWQTDKMKITKTTVREYEICDCAKWRQTIGETLAFRESRGIKNRGLDKCFVCGYKFGNEEYPYLALIKNYKNQFICEKCAEKVNPDRVRSETGNDEKTV